MHIVVQPRYYPVKGIQSVEISVMIEFSEEGVSEEETAMRRFLDLLSKSEALEITALPTDSFGTPICLRVSGKALAVDW